MGGTGFLYRSNYTTSDGHGRSICPEAVRCVRRPGVRVSWIARDGSRTRGAAGPDPKNLRGAKHSRLEQHGDVAEWAAENTSTSWRGLTSRLRLPEMSMCHGLSQPRRVSCPTCLQCVVAGRI